MSTPYLRSEYRNNRQIANEKSRTLASRHGDPWEPWEDELLLGLGVRGGQPLIDAAEELHRTVEACRNRLCRLLPAEHPRGHDQSSEPEHPMCPRCFCLHAGEC